MRGAISTVFYLAFATLRAPNDPAYPLRIVSAPMNLLNVVLIFAGAAVVTAIVVAACHFAPLR